MDSRKMSSVAAVMGLVAGLRCGGETAAPEYCEAASLGGALAAARPGDIVRVGACRIDGSFEVPAGVTLAGRGRDTSAIATSGNWPAARLVPGVPPTRLVDISVVSAANVGILARGAGEVDLQHVAVRSTRGIAVGVEDLTAITMTDVAMTGPVTASNQSGWSNDPLITATHGLVIIRVENAYLTNVTSTGFALFGALLVDDTTTWFGGGAPANIGTGLMIDGGAATLEDLDLTSTMDGDRGTNAYGVVFKDDCQVATARLNVSGGDDLGILQKTGRSRHEDLSVNGNGDVGVWLQACSSFDLSGTSTVSANRFGAVVAVESQNVSITGARIDATRAEMHVLEETGTGQVGDGLQLVRTTVGVRLAHIALSGNERVGLLLELGGSSTNDIVIDDVQVEATGSDAYGAVAQGGAIEPGWDDGVRRLGDTATNDTALGGRRLENVPPLLDTDIPATPTRDGSITDLAAIVDPEPPP